MTTTTKTITISLEDSTDESVTAEYYIIEDGWVTFKTSDHKAVAAYPEKRVTRIKRADTDPQMDEAAIARKVRQQVVLGMP